MAGTILRRAVLAIALMTWAGAVSAATYAERVTEKVLPNGLKLIILEDHKAPVGVLQVWYRVGSRNEEPGRTGLSHLLEHMMFKGTKKVGPDEYSRLITRNGGDENAFTSQDNTTYFATLASDRLQVAVDLEADRMANLVFDEKLFLPERDVVAEERRLRTDDNPTSALFELLSSQAYVAHPYQWPTVGWMTDIQQATVRDLADYYRMHYQPGNAFVLVVGDVDAERFAKQLEKAFGKVPRGKAPPPPVRSIEPPQQGERRAVLRREAELPFVGIGYHVPSAPHADSAALEVLEQVLSGGKSARLYDELVYQKRVALSAGASYDTLSKDPGMFVVYGQPMPGKSAAEIEAALLDEVEWVKSNDVSERALEKAKNQLESAFTMAQDSLFAQGMLLGQYEIAGDWRFIDAYIPAIRNVTAADLRRVAMTYLGTDNRTVATLDPLPPSGERRHRPAPAAPQSGPVH